MNGSKLNTEAPGDSMYMRERNNNLFDNPNNNNTNSRQSSREKDSSMKFNESFKNKLSDYKKSIESDE